MAWYDSITPENALKVGLAPVTGGASLLPGTNSLRDNPVSNFVLGKGQPQQPGVGGPAKDPSKLVLDPSTGMYFDPTTGTAYTDGWGTTPVANPNVAQQVAENFSRSQAFMGQLTGLETQRQGVLGKENQLEDSLHRTIAGRGPSVAGMQLGEGLNAISNEQLSQAAGISGPTAPLAQLQAARNTGSASVATNNAAAQARIQEQNDATNALTRLLAAHGAQTEAALGRTTGAGLASSQLALGGQESQQGLNASADKSKADSEEKFGYSFLKSLGGAAGL